MESTDFPNRLLGELRLNESAHNNNGNDNRSNVDIAGTLFSPDEFVIRQRGRRRISLWSPDTNPITTTQTSSPFQRTPTKMPLSTSMILRSSPRKRLTMGSIPKQNDEINTMGSPIKTNVRTQLWVDTPGNAKKARLNETEYASIASCSEIPLATLLRGYSQNQLIQIILEQVVDGAASNDRSREEQLRKRLPTPKIDTQERELQHAKRNIYKSLPTSRLTSKTDSSAFSRASVHMTEFKRLVGNHAKDLQESCHWDALLDYVMMAWPYVRATPIWDNTIHNTIRRQCFKLLSSNCLAAVRASGLRLGSERLKTLEKNLNDWAKDYEDVLVCISTLNKALAKGRTSW